MRMQMASCYQTGYVQDDLVSYLCPSLYTRFRMMYNWTYGIIDEGKDKTSAEDNIELLQSGNDVVEAMYDDP